MVQKERVGVSIAHTEIIWLHCFIINDYFYMQYKQNVESVIDKSELAGRNTMQYMCYSVQRNKMK